MHGHSRKRRGARVFAVPVLMAYAALAVHAAAAQHLGEPVITQILGTSLKFDNKPTPAELRRAASDIAGKGFTLSWDASPATWERDILNHPDRVAHCRRVAELIHEHGMSVAFGFQWQSLLPPDTAEAFSDCPWAGEVLDPETGAFVRK